MVTVKPPAEMASPQSLRSVRYQRPDPHLKHVTTDQGIYREHVQREGFDDALLTGDDGVISETTMTNIGFLDDEGVVWPDAPMLLGVTMQLLEQQLPELGVPTRRASVRVRDIPSFEGAFLSNARGIAVVNQVDDMALGDPTERMEPLADAYDSVPWEKI
jgi:branched-subunit amino acid aminotransferase/4-amino-4-deoxychorismate lyase